MRVMHVRVLNALAPIAVASLIFMSADTYGKTTYPAGPLRDNLLQLAENTEVSIFFAEDLVQGIVVPASSLADMNELLEFWLSPNCLEAEFIRSRFIAIGQASNCGAASITTEIKGVASLSLPQSSPPSMEEMLVTDRPYTGSRLRQNSLGQSMPVDVIDQEEIRLSGLQSVSELLRYVPAVSGNSTSTLISNGGDGTATITLRGLPASNTLVLLNGRRTNFDALTGDAVDLNSLPLSMIDSIEILKDGVSAIYGSDAVAGVVNIITKRYVTGFTADIYQGISQESDLETSRFSLQFGHVDENWHASLSVSAYKQDGVFSRDRSLSASSDDRRRGGIDKRSSADAPALIITGSDTRTLGAVGTGTSLSDFRPVTDDDRFEYRDYTSSIVPLERQSAYLTVGWETAEQWDSGFDVLYSRTSADTTFAPVPIFTGFESVPLPISADNVFNPFGEEITDLRRRVVELPGRRQFNDSETLRAIFHTAVKVGDFDVRGGLQYDRTEADEDLRYSVHGLRLAESLSDSCVAPCVPVNLFGPAGSITGEMLAWLGTRGKVSGSSTLSAVTIDVDWRGHERIELVAGLELRKERIAVEVNDVLADGYLVGGGNRGETRGDRNVVEVYSEVYLPILRGEHGADVLSSQIAVRASKYSDFGTVINPRLLVTYNAPNNWLFRASVGRGFRAPTLPQLYGSMKQSFQQLYDPCSVIANIDSYLGCDQQSDPALNQFLAIGGGDRNLDPERSQTVSFGTLWQAERAKAKYAFSVDAFLIDQEDVVDSSAQYIVNQSARYNAFTNRVSRDSNGNLQRIYATLQNIGSREVSGLDISATSEWQIKGVGELQTALNATHIHRFRDKFDPSSPSVDKAGTFSDEASEGLGSLPDWKVSLSLAWANDHWQGYYNIYWISSLKERIPLSDEYRTIDDWTTHNFNLSYLGPATAWIRTTVGVQNIWNESPPFSAAAFNDSYDGRTYDITGRYFFLKLDKTL